MIHCPECGRSFPDDPLDGVEVGPYRVAHLVGAGGMGRVYKGVHPGINSRVAIKVLSHECASRPELVERFFAEARAVNLIRHESIVNVLDLSWLPDRRPCIVMEYLDGAPLSHAIASRGRLPVGTLARVMGEVLGALGAAHQKGVVHRDVKPDNVFVSPQGRAKVLDFGIAKLAAEHMTPGASPTRADSLLGTPHYMSPEQAMSRPADARSDLYAVGVILYEATTGQKPFTGTSVYEILRGHVEAMPPPPRQLAQWLPPAYEQVILRALAKDPAYRWQYADEMARALEAACQGLWGEAWEPLLGGERARPPDSLGPPTPAATPPAPAPPRRGRAGWFVAAGAVLVAAAAAAVVLASQDEANHPEVAAAPVAAPSPTPTPTPNPSPSPSPSPNPGPDPISSTIALKVPDPAGPPTAPSPSRSPSPAPSRSPSPAPVPPAPLPVPAQPTPAPAKTDEAPRPAPPPETEAAEPAPSSKRPLTDRINQPNPKPKAFDVSGYYRTAEQLARSYFDDAVLFRIDADGVRPDGTANLSLDDGFSVLYRFMSPSAGKRPADLPKGVEHKPTCIVYVLVNASEISVYTLKGWSCEDEIPLRRPRCSAKEVWARAAAAGAPTDNVVAELGLRATGGKATWWHDIKGEKGGHTFPDDC